MRSVKILVLAVVVVLLTACTDGNIDQKNLCEVSEWQHDSVAKVCTKGQKVVFLPNSFGNKQLPVLFAAVNCDLRYSIALTEGAVSCIYNPFTPKPAKNTD